MANHHPIWVNSFYTLIGSVFLTERGFSNHMAVVRYCKKSSKVIEFQNFDVLLLQYGLSSRIIGKGFV